MKTLLSTALLSLALASTSAAAASFGTSYTNGNTSTTGKVHGSSVQTVQTEGFALAGAGTSLSAEIIKSSESTVGNYGGSFGSISSYTSNGITAGALALDEHTEVGSGWSVTKGKYVTQGTSSVYSAEGSYVGDFSGGALGGTLTETTVEYDSTTRVKTVDNYDFGSYSVTVGAAK